jgi:DNA-binding transcriptional LysR family regulator
VVDVVRIYWHDQTDSLLDGRVDVALLHLPVTTAGLKLVPLYDAPRVALLPRNHPLADRQEVSITDLANDPVILHRGASPAWEAFHNTDPRPDGSHPRSGPVVSNIEEKLEQVAAGRAISFLPVSAAVAITLQPDVVVVPVTDIPPTHVCLAWSVEAESELIRTFVSLVPDTIDTDGWNETRSFLPALVRAPATPD